MASPSSSPAEEPHSEVDLNSASRLLRLPAELRQMILEIVLFEQVAPRAPSEDLYGRRLIVTMRNPEAGTKDPRSPSLVLLTQPNLGILQICHQLRVEAQHMLQETGRRNEYRIDLMCDLSGSLWATWLNPSKPPKHLRTLHTTIRLFKGVRFFKKTGLNGRTWSKPPYVDYKDLFFLLATYLQHGSGSVKAYKDVAEAKFTIGTIVVDIISTDGTSPDDFRECSMRTRAPGRSTPVKTAETKPSTWCMPHFEWFPAVDREQPSSVVEDLASDLYHVTKCIPRLPKFRNGYKLLWDGVSTVEFKADGRMMHTVDVWKTVEETLSAEITLPWRADFETWQLGAQRRRRERGLWMSKEEDV